MKGGIIEGIRGAIVVIPAFTIPAPSGSTANKGSYGEHPGGTVAKAK